MENMSEIENRYRRSAWAKLQKRCTILKQDGARAHTRMQTLTSMQTFTSMHTRVHAHTDEPRIWRLLFVSLLPFKHRLGSSVREKVFWFDPHWQTCTAAKTVYSSDGHVLS